MQNETISTPHTTSLQSLYQMLQSTCNGLEDKEIRQRQEQFGLNELKVKQSIALHIHFLMQFKNFFALLLIVGGLLALLAENLTPGLGNLYIAVALFSVVLLNAIFTFIQEFQSERILASFQKMLPTKVQVRRAGTNLEIDARELVPGDIMLLFEGDKVPADGRLISSNELKVDLSSLTGESDTILLSAENQNQNLLESRNMVFSGSLVQSGNAVVLVCHTGMKTEIGKIVQLTKDADTVETPIRRELKYFIKIISSIAIVLGTLFFLISVAIGNSAISSLIFAVGIIVANVPEGLLPTVTLALTMASKRMARKNALIKNLESVETLGSTTVICTDKTGTLTQNSISVHRIVTPNKNYSFDDVDLPVGVEAILLSRIMTLCNNAYLSADKLVGDSTETALLECAKNISKVDDFSEYVRLHEIPFTSMSRFMSTLNSTPEGKREAYLKGAPEVVFEFCDRISVGEQIVQITTEHRDWFSQSLKHMALKGERCLALAYCETDENLAPEAGYIFVGIVGMLDPPRVEVPDALKKCHDAGIRVFMLTGDYALTAKTIAEDIGLLGETGRVVEGEELLAMDETAFHNVLDHKSLVFARISPMQKLQIVQALQQKGEVVTVTGDGVNDAPALKHADMGVAMGIIGTDVAKEASNMVLMDDNFATIVAAVEEGRTIFDNIKKFIAYILTSNIPEILPFIAFIILDIPLPLTVVLILAIDLGTDILPALGLGAEKPESDVMHKPPRARSERLLTRNLLGMSYGIIGMIQAAAGFFSYFIVLYSNGWQWGQELLTSDPIYRTAITAFFASIIICQIADVLICRTRRQSIFTVGLFSNKLLWFGIGAECLLLVCITYIPAFNVFFGTAPLEPWHLALSIPFAIVILIGDELRRVFVRRENSFVLKWLTW